MNAIGHYPNGKAIWRCDACGFVNPWNDSWGWYGSMKDMDDGTMRAIWCSAPCQQLLSRQKGGIEKPRSKDREKHFIGATHA